MLIEADHTHLYPGATCRIVEGRARTGACLISFSDGASAMAHLTCGTDAARLSVDRYTTARGTRIPPRCWTLAVAGDGRLRVQKRCPEERP